MALEVYPPELLHPLSRRDEFAKAAMQGILARAQGSIDIEWTVAKAIAIADAMIEKLGEESRRQVKP